MNDFYVGYLPKAPTALARFVRKVIIALGLIAITAALVLVVGQMPFAIPRSNTGSCAVSRELSWGRNNGGNYTQLHRCDRYRARNSRDDSRPGNRDGHRRNRRQQVLPGS